MSNAPIKNSTSDVPGIQFIMGGLAACGAVTFTNPWEVVKTRLQLQGELAQSKGQPKVYRGVLHAFYRIAKVEGIATLQRGLLPAYMYQLTMNGMRFGGYDYLKYFMYDTLGVHPSTWINILLGATSGTIGAALGSPFFLVKTRLQSYSKHFTVGAQHYYSSTWNAFSTIYRTERLRGLYAGAEAAMLRTGIGSSIQLSTYDNAKALAISSGLVGDGIWAHFTAALTSGFMVCVGMNPFDVVSTRMYNQPIDHKTGKGLTYSSPIDCLLKTARVEGVTGLYKGFLAHYLRIGPHTILCFVFLVSSRNDTPVQ